MGAGRIGGAALCGCGGRRMLVVFYRLCYCSSRHRRWCCRRDHCSLLILRTQELIVVTPNRLSLPVMLELGRSQGQRLLPTNLEGRASSRAAFFGPARRTSSAHSLREVADTTVFFTLDWLPHSERRRTKSTRRPLSLYQSSPWGESQLLTTFLETNDTTSIDMYPERSTA